LARKVVDSRLEGQDIIITSVRDSTLLMISDLLRTGLTKDIRTEETINELQDLMEMLGISGNLDLVMPVCFNNQDKNKLKGGALGRDRSSSMVPDFSQVLEVSSSESEDYSDCNREEIESRMNYKLKCKTAPDNSMLDRISESGLNLRKRSRQELILRSGSSQQLNKRMKLSSRDESGRMNKKKISAEKFSRKNNDSKDKLILDILEVSSDEDASEDDLQEVHDDGKMNYQQFVRNQFKEGGVLIEGFCGGDPSSERKTHKFSAKYPALDLSTSSGPSDSLWQASKEEFLSLFGLCTLAQAEQIRVKTAEVSAGRSRIRLRRCRKGKSVK